MKSPLKFDVSEDGRLLVFGLESLTPAMAEQARADIREQKDQLIDEVAGRKKRLAEIVTEYADNSLTDEKRTRLDQEGCSLIASLPDDVVKRIFEEN